MESFDEDLDVIDEFSVVNEFAAVRVRRVRSRNGERLEIHSPRFEKTVRLDATVLEALSWQTSETLSAFVEDMP